MDLSLKLLRRSFISYKGIQAGTVDLGLTAEMVKTSSLEEGVFFFLNHFDFASFLIPFASVLSCRNHLKLGCLFFY